MTTPETAPTRAGRRPTRCRALRLPQQPITQPHCSTSTLVVSAVAQARPNPTTNQPPLNPYPVTARAARSNSQRRGRMRPPQGLHTHGQRGGYPLHGLQPSAASELLPSPTAGSYVACGRPVRGIPAVSHPPGPTPPHGRTAELDLTTQLQPATAGQQGSPRGRTWCPPLSLHSRRPGGGWTAEGPTVFHSTRPATKPTWHLRGSRVASGGPLITAASPPTYTPTAAQPRRTTRRRAPTVKGYRQVPQLPAALSTPNPSSSCSRHGAALLQGRDLP